MTGNATDSLLTRNTNKDPKTKRGRATKKFFFLQLPLLTQKDEKWVVASGPERVGKEDKDKKSAQNLG